MKTLIIYDSYFGNTEKIAKSILSNARVMNVKEFQLSDLEDVELLIVGSPTRAFRPTEAIQKFLKSLPKNSLKGLKVASFDTRISPEDMGSALLVFIVSIFGYAAEPISKELIKKGGELTIKPTGFFVNDKEGPLKEGERERAKNWLNDIIGNER